MDKITHQIRAEHWGKIMNECINSGRSKTAWCRVNGISEKQFFYWKRILRREAFENSLNPLLSATAEPHQELEPADQRTVSLAGFLSLSKVHHAFYSALRAFGWSRSIPDISQSNSHQERYRTSDCFLAIDSRRGQTAAYRSERSRPVLGTRL